MLKKAGIIVTVAAAGLLAAGSFAFADETITDDNGTNTCSFGQTGGAIDNPQAGGSAGLGVVANVVTSAIAPVLAQAPVGNCLNVDLEDLVDDGSNNVTKTKNVTEIVDSNNQ